MTTRESSSPSESCQEEAPSVLAKRHNLRKKNEISRSQYRDGGDGGGDSGDGECDKEAWNTLSKCFRRVQSALDQNRSLIQQVNENHQSMIPDNLVKNVALIREINGNISKVTSLYSDLSVDFAGVIRQRRSTAAAASESDNGEEARNE